jgi:hypothetical protein
MRTAVVWLACLLMLTGAAVAFSSGRTPAAASPIPICATDTLSDYTSLPNGCTIEDKTFFLSGVLHRLGEPPQIPFESVTVTPDSTPGNPGLTFTSTDFSPSGFGCSSIVVLGPVQCELAFGYVVRVNPGGQPIDAVTLSVSGAQVTGTGTMDITKSICAVSSCNSGNILSESVDAGSTSATTSFSPTTLVQGQDDLLLDTGTNGTAGLSSFTNTFAEVPAVPEPASWSLLGLGLAAMAAWRRSGGFGMRPAAAGGHIPQRASRKRVITLRVMRETLTSTSRHDTYVIDPTEKTAPPLAVS